MLPIINLFISSFMMIVIFTYFICVILDSKVKIKLNLRYIVLFLVNIGCHLILGTFFYDFLKTVTMFLADSFYCYKLFNISFKRSLYVTFCFMVLLIVPDLIQLFLVTNVVGINKIICYNEIAGSVISNLMVCIIFIIMVNILKKFLRKILNIEISNNLKIVILLLITFIGISLYFYIFASEFKIDGNSLPYFISMCILVVILFSLIKQTIENDRLMREYDKLLEFMMTYENEIEKQRILRHETKNEFLAIKAKLCDKQKDKEIIDYIDEILKEKIIVNQEKYAKFGYLPPNGIKGLCYFKVQEAEKFKIDVSINVSKKVQKSSVYNLSVKEQRDFGKVLGVFLDNAIEASSNSKSKKLGIEVYVDRNNEFIMIISNTFDNVINKNKLGKERVTTKGKDRGHGLLLVKHIISKSSIFEIKTEIINNIYVQTLKIKKD